MGILAGKTSHFVLSKLGRGSTLPGKIALKFDKNILDTLAKDYEIVVVKGLGKCNNSNSGCIIFSNVGSPNQPKPKDVTVIPNWQADK